MLLPVRRRHQNADVLPDRLFGRVAEQRSAVALNELHDPMVVDHDHRVRHGVKHRPQMRLAFLESDLGAFGGGDVARDFGCPDQVAGPVKQRRDGQLKHR